MCLTQTPHCIRGTAGRLCAEGTDGPWPQGIRPGHGVEQGACAEPGAPTAYSSLGKVSGDRREGGLLRGGRKIGVQELCWFVLNCCRIPSVGEKPIMRPSEGWQYTMPSELCLLPQATKDRTADGQALTEARKQLKEETQLRLVRTGGLGAHPTGLQRVTAMLSPCSIQV